MAKLNIVILDNDRIFMEKTSNYLINKTQKFTVSVFSDLERFKEFISNKKQDIILFSEDYLEEIEKYKTDAIKIIMAETLISESQEYASVKKYQKIDIFVRDILFIYAEKTGDSSYIQSDDVENKLISVYSPVGGSGKTTLAILLAKALALSGENVLYLNFERVSSMAGIFNNNSINNMTEIFLTAKMNKKNIAAKILANMLQNQISKIYYINPAESSSEYAQVTDEEIMEIINAAESLDEISYVIIDFVGEFNKRVFDVLQKSRKIVFPYLGHDLSRQKVAVFIEEMKKLKYEGSILEKTIFVENCVTDEEETDDASIKIRYNPEYKNIKAMLKNSAAGLEDLEPIIRKI